MLNIFKNKSDINQKKLYVEILSDKSKEYFLNAIIEDVKNHHINGNSIEEYNKIAGAYCKSKCSKLFLDEAKEIAISIFVLRLGDVYIGCSMIYQFPDYIEFMYIHISAEYRNQRYGKKFYEALESYVPLGTLMKIRCYETSPEGVALAQSVGYKLSGISNQNTRIFFKIK